jgi:hypothetical protein
VVAPTYPTSPSRTPLLVAVGVVALGGGIGGAWWWSKRDRAAAADDVRDAGAIALAPADAAPPALPPPVDPDAPATPTGGFETGATRSFYGRPQGAVVTRPLATNPYEPHVAPIAIDVEGVDDAAEVFATPGVWHRHPLGFSVRLPPNWQEMPAQEGGKLYAGMFDGTAAMVAVFGAPISGLGFSFDDDSLRAGAAQLLIANGAVPRDLKVGRRGRQVLSGIVDLPAYGGTAEMRLYRGQEAIALIMVGATTADFRATAAARKRFFADDVRPPR